MSPFTSVSFAARSASVLGLSTGEAGSAPDLADGRCAEDMARLVGLLLRSAIAVAAAAPAASNAVPASTLGQRRDERGRGGSSRLAVAASIAETLGAKLSCTVTLPRAARTAIHARTRPTLGLAQLAALPAPRRAVRAALLVDGPA